MPAIRTSTLWFMQNLLYWVPSCGRYSAGGKQHTSQTSRWLSDWSRMSELSHAPLDKLNQSVSFLQVLKEMKFPEEQGINVLVIQKTFTDQGSSVSQQLFRAHELNPLICSLNQTKFLQVTRGSLADEKHLPALTVLSSQSLDKAFFLTFSLCNICPKTFLRKFLAGFQLVWKAVLTLITANPTSPDMKDCAFKATRIRK